MKVDERDQPADRGARPLPDPDRDRRIGSASRSRTSSRRWRPATRAGTLSLDAPRRTDDDEARTRARHDRSATDPGYDRVEADLASGARRPRRARVAGAADALRATSSPRARSAAASASRRCRSRESAAGLCGSCSPRCAARTRAVRCPRRRAARNSRFGSRRPGRRMTTTEQARKESEMSERIEGKRVAFLVANEGVEQVELTSRWQAVRGRRRATGADRARAGRGPGASTTSTRPTRSTSTGPSTTRTPATTTAWCCRAGSRTPTSCGPIAGRGRVHARLLRGGQAGGGDLPRPRGRWSRPAWSRGRTLTSWPSLQTDIRNAGGEWVDEEVHVDQGLVTAASPTTWTPSARRRSRSSPRACTPSSARRRSARS